MKTKREIHNKLVDLEDLLNKEEIVSFRMTVFSKLSDSTSTPVDGDAPITESMYLDVDEIALGSISVLSV